MADPFQIMANNFNKSDLAWDDPPEPVVPPVVPIVPAPALSDNYIGRYAFFVDSQGNRNPVGKVIKKENMGGGSIKYTTDQNIDFYNNQVTKGKVVLEISPPVLPPSPPPDNKISQSVFGIKDKNFWGYVVEEAEDGYIIKNQKNVSSKIFKNAYNKKWIWGEDVKKQGGLLKLGTGLNPAAKDFKPGTGFFGGSKRYKCISRIRQKPSKTKKRLSKYIKTKKIRK